MPEGDAGSFYLSEAQREHFETRRRNIIARTRQETSRLPDKFFNGTVSFATFPIKTADDTNARDVMAGWTTTALKANFAMPLDNPFVFLVGPVGTGKSFLASCAIAEATHHVRNAVFVSRVEMIADVQQAFSDDADFTELRALRNYADASVLAIDDFDKGDATSFVLKCLWYIIDWRYRNDLPTIITSNKSFADLFALFTTDRRTKRRMTELEDTAEAILDRVSGSAVIIELTGPTKRSALKGDR